MKLGALKPSIGATHSKKRVGRGQGSGWGKDAGRGENGYHSRSGSKHRPWFEGGQMPLYRRLPKRGFSNYIFKKEFQLVNLADIEKLNVDTVDPNVLVENGLVKYALRPIKILGDGDFTKKMNVSANAFSASAKEKIEKAGGSVIEQ
ncbi:MAG: 50S ribosomal protein L15 [Candidatus Marinimicrobia bacterium]|jgi:large subunit ribosomal protein L15|nr:50S ribosomal protein L15 [Candidatus Neomarinimicrobiota bacterium]MBT3948241.1 50S ribosomal protein L15 [Candidatus Neomarinimicrobiota bacterium]MBT4064247.1 50S ribosomal protein L15 [Candidatus Neomarinimicrobiota bacterium]MBT4308505.1 50S ribosomal protein L15 [Candidatus Neomarinimicrobiota bacterium]MBT4452536.1 50S ribosomal protein L15 [Candidatus Neomarinimicrobiota bacterium]|tara:strand:- start:8503 stop:8943 length:441 start_codon:yes stop_codon:yes gene_type:complete